jgi:hypothetical protein
LGGNATGKTLRTTVTHGATRNERCSARCIRRCRSRVAGLLKTTLQSIVPAATHSCAAQQKAPRNPV